MSWLLPISVVIATTAFMEFFAWWAHKYIMHGWGWGWHKSHHEERHGRFEMNDLYAVVFAVFAIAMFAVGEWAWRPATWLAIGVTLYGVLYFVAHDGLVHKRWPFTHVPRRGYAKRLYQAHRLHHAVDGKEGCVSFGFIYAKPVKDLKAELERNRHSGR